MPRPTATHEQFRIGGFISFWLGNFASEKELDEYLSLNKTFRDDFNFEIYPPDGPEASVKDGPKPIKDLLAGFSRSQTFVEAAIVEATAKGWTKATTAVVFYNFKYDSAFVDENSSGLLSFVGVVPFPGFGLK